MQDSVGTLLPAADEDRAPQLTERLAVVASSSCSAATTCSYTDKHATLSRQPFEEITRWKDTGCCTYRKCNGPHDVHVLPAYLLFVRG